MRCVVWRAGARCDTPCAFCISIAVDTAALSNVGRVVHGFMTAEKTVEKTNWAMDLCISARLLSESVLAGRPSDESRSAMGIVDGRPTPKVDDPWAIPAVGDPENGIVWRVRDVANKMRSYD